MANERNSKLLITFFAFLLLINYPLLNIVDKQDTWLGVPVLYFYLFVVWLLLIISIAAIVDGRNKK